MVKIIAHRGLRQELPENTCISIQAAIDLPGVDGVEFDVELSDRPVVLHQETLIPDAQCCRLELATRNFIDRDWVSEIPSGKITTLDAGSWVDPKFAQLRVPYLEEVLALEWGSKRAYIELKDPTFWGQRDISVPERIANAISPVLKNFAGAATIISFNPAILRRYIQIAPQSEIGLNFWVDYKNRSDQALTIASDLGVRLVLLEENMAIADKNWVHSFQNSGIEVFVYPVSPTLGEAEFAHWTPQSQYHKWEALAELGVDGILSDFPRQTVEFFR